MRWLLWGAERVGDVVMAIPAMKRIRQLLPESRLTLVTTDYAREVADICGLLDQTLTYRFKGGWKNRPFFWRLRRRIVAGEFDRIVLLGKVTKFHRRLLRDHPAIVAPVTTEGLHTAERHVATIHAALPTRESAPASPRLYPDISVPDDAARLRRLVAHGVPVREGGYLVVHAATNRTLRKRLRPSRQIAGKLWPPDRQRAFLRAVAQRWPGRPVFLVGAAAERRFVEREILAPLAVEERPHSLVGATAIADLLVLLKHASLLVCCDSGVMHLATMVRCPLVALFGPTDETVTGPYTDDPRVWRVREPGGGRDIRSLRVETVLRAVAEALDGPAEGGPGARAPGCF